MAKKPYPSEVLDRYIVRFPEGMRDQVARAAEKNGRSMNAEIVARIARTFDQDAGGGAGDQVANIPLAELDELLPKLAQSIEENAKMRVLMNKQMEMLSQTAGQKLVKFVVGDLEYTVDEAAKPAEPTKPAAKRAPRKPKA